ncbi:MAG: phosphatase PAP2 family protein [Verrucomicrobiota bacterium]
MNMKTSVLKVTPQKFDVALAGFDRALFGTTLSDQAGKIAAPWLTEILSFCYLLFFPYLLISLCYYTYRGIPMMRRLMVGLFTVYGIGFLGYSWIPAGGPHLAFPEEFGVPLTGWAITRFNAWVVANGSNGVDVFPSLHCAVSCYLLFFDKRHSPWRFRLYLIPCAGIWVATIYLRYHYAIDLVAGFSLAVFALWLTKRWAKNDSLHPTLLS